MRLSVLLLLGASLAAPQDWFHGSRFTDEFDGRLRGFAKSPTEHIINDHPNEPELRSVQGCITTSGGPERMADALFEIRPESPSARAWHRHQSSWLLSHPSAARHLSFQGDPGRLSIGRW
jgi:hypothetical protein